MASCARVLLACRPRRLDKSATSADSIRYHLVVVVHLIIWRGC